MLGQNFYSYLKSILKTIISICDINKSITRMKVLHISTSDRQGGAAIAAYRLNEALQNEGVDSKMLVYNKITLNPTVERFSSFCSIWEKLFYKPSSLCVL